MAKARKLIEYFTKSTQATKKLLKYQEDCNLGLYGVEGYIPKRLIQDAITRWWSTYRALKRLRLLKPALVALSLNQEVDCTLLEDDQWIVLEQIEDALRMMATWQRLLEGDKYPTGSLVVMAIFQIRKHFVKVLSNPNTKEPVKRLVETLLKDFDEKRYIPEAEGKVRFTREVQIGARNRYVSVHPNFFIAAFLDPRCRKGLEKHWMIPEQYDDLRAMILDLMVDVAKATNPNTNDNGGEGGSNGEAQVSSKSEDTSFAFLGAFDFDDDAAANDDEVTDENIRIRCEAQLKAYELVEQLPIKEGGKFNDPLKRWKQLAHQFPELATLAREYLCIPATSASSERIWSRAARVVTAKRSCIDPIVTSRIMFVEENTSLIRKHWDELMPGVPLTEFLLPPSFEDKDENGDPIDAGQNDE